MRINLRHFIILILSVLSNFLIAQTSQFWYTYFRGIPDYSRLNALRLRSNHGLDVRLDKKWYFSTWTLNLYLDIENIYNFKTELPPEIGIDPNLGDLAYPNDGELINSPMLYQIVNESGTVLPSIGILIEF